MKNLTLVAVLATVLSCSVTQAQETAAVNPFYERLKVLEPLIGKYSADTIRRGGKTFEQERSIFWSARKRMIVATTRIRQEQQDWEEIQNRQFFYWNAAEDRIEFLRIWPPTGRVDRYEVIPESDDKFVFEQLSSSRRAGTSKQTWTVTAEGIAGRETAVNGAGLPRQIRRSLRRI